jgi:aldehyde dehydrogenase (NAD+)
MTSHQNAVGIQHPECLYINGTWRAPASGATIDVINCYTEELFLSVGKANVDDVNAAVQAAREAFDRGPWPRLSHRERAAYISAIARELDSRADDLARIWTSESGVTHNVSKGRSTALGDRYRHYANIADTYPFESVQKPTAGSANFALLVREPVGVVAAIIPWNGPSGLIANKLAPALLAGCTVIIKASPEAPGAAYVVAEACAKANLPAGVVTVLTADRDVSEALVRHPGVDKVAFTGSTAAGKRIAAICAERVARCTLELGGKSAAVILDDCDLGTVAESISKSARVLTGQICASLTRVIVSRKRHDALVDALCASFGHIKVGDPFDPATDMGPLATSIQRDRVERYIEIGRRDGAWVAVGGGRPKELRHGFFVEPTVFGRVDNCSVIAREEIFGPVLCVIPADSEADAIDIANDSPYGLNASVFTQDVDRAYAAARRLRTGTVGHNAYRSDMGIAFGGFKQSGIGREGGLEGLLPYLESKTVLLDGIPAHLVGGAATQDFLAPFER